MDTLQYLDKTKHENIITIPEILLRQYAEGYLYESELKFNFDDGMIVAINFYDTAVCFSLHNKHDSGVISKTINSLKVNERKDIFEIFLRQDIKRQTFIYDDETYIIKLKIV